MRNCRRAPRPSRHWPRRFALAGGSCCRNDRIRGGAVTSAIRPASLGPELVTGLVPLPQRTMSPGAAERQDTPQLVFRTLCPACGTPLLPR
jgi:hypothetical protein